MSIVEWWKSKRLRTPHAIVWRVIMFPLLWVATAVAFIAVLIYELDFEKANDAAKSLLYY